MLQRAICGLLLLLLFATQASADINVFIYHRFGDSRYPSTNISTEVFAEQLAYLQQHDYQVLPLSRIAQMVRSGHELPENTVGLCIDDAFTSFAREAVPLLEKYRFPATLFVNTDAVGTPGYLDWEQLREVVGRGVEIGNHTGSHAYLVEMAEGESPRQWLERIRLDIEKSKRELAAHLGIEPDIFAYTYGEYSPAVIELIKQAGFKSAFAQQSGVISRWSDNWALPRFPMGGPYATLNGFVAKLRMRALPVMTAEPVDPVIRTQNPPPLRLKLANDDFALAHINCFVQGDNRCRVEMESANKDELLILAEKPLHSRRNKYTLTTLGKDGRWYWFSQLWINADRPGPVHP